MSEGAYRYVRVSKRREEQSMFGLLQVQKVRTRSPLHDAEFRLSVELINRVQIITIFTIFEKGLSVISLSYHMT